MLFTRLCRFPGHSFLLFLLLFFSLPGCRSPEPPAEEKKGADQAAVQTAIEPLPAFLTATPPPPLPPPAMPENERPAAPSASGAEEVSTPETAASRPLVAIIIDDMGHNQQPDRQFVHIEATFSFSFLPHAPFTAELAEQAFHRGHDVLVHLPMEPKDKKWRLEKGALLVRDSPERIRRKTEEMLATTPHAIGANNHMGSLFSEDGKGMRVVLETLKARSFFFVDSYTSAASQGLQTARRLRLPSARRHIFLDNVKDTVQICRQIDLLVDLAHRQGQAIGIGHPNQAMLAALAGCGQGSLQSIELVGVHRLVH